MRKGGQRNEKERDRDTNEVFKHAVQKTAETIRVSKKKSEINLAEETKATVINLDNGIGRDSSQQAGC